MTVDPSLFVVITSISAPTDPVRAFGERLGDRLVVVGDRKTPSPWGLGPTRYLGPDEQATRGWKLTRLLPWNHYSRKVLGYLEAARSGAEIIYDTDDDNAPKPTWGVPPFDGCFEKTDEDLGFVNVYRLFTDQHIWPRGFPLKGIRDGSTVPGPDRLRPAGVSVGVWQALADDDPDVDAIYRLAIGAPCFFREREPVVLGRGTLCPFNSQATAFRKCCFPLLYLPAGVTSRVTDILRSLVAQPILWAAGLHLGFTSSTVVQERNPHDLLRDLDDELPLYRHTEAMTDRVVGAVRGAATMEDNVMAAYEALATSGFVDDVEPTRVEAWLEDLGSSG